ncbi:MAG TPA: S9 family peptidase, partial [Thermoanaerobaculia bacterium]|nr:S9 family peptidase [Thermoanaerobaculia bacterium]
MRFRTALRRTCAGIAAASLAALAGSAEKISYPAARQGDEAAVHHGVTVPDPYRWLEAAPEASPEVAAWVEAQNRLSESFLQAIPERERIRRHLDRIWSAESRGAPVRQGGRYFFTRSDGRQERPVLYVQDSLLQEPRVLLDPNRWSADGSAGLTNFAASRDGRYLGYGISEAGSDWQKYRILEIGTGRTLDEELRGIKTCCLAWTADHQGFYYGAWPAPGASPATAPLLHHKIYYHRVGTPQSADRVIHEQPDHPDWFFFPHLTEDG